MNRFTLLDGILLSIFIFLAPDVWEQLTKTDEPSSSPSAVVYSEEFGSDINVSLVEAQPGDTILGLCNEFRESNFKGCVRYIVFRNREQFPAVLDSEDDFYLKAGEDYLIPVK